jgi:hypothetical protein
VADTRVKDLLEHVPVNCPTCGNEGFIRIDRLNRGLGCRKCGAKFFIDHTGTRVVGEPPAGRTDLVEQPPWMRNRRNAWADRFFRPVFNRFLRLPRWARLSALGLPVLLLAAASLAWAIREPPPPTPPGLADRAAIVGQAFGRGDTGPISDLAVRGTGRAARDWVEQRRPPAWGGETDEDAPVRVQTQILTQDNRKGQATVVLVVDRPTTVPPVGESPSEVELVTLWVQNDDGEWELDCKQTALRKP